MVAIVSARRWFIATSQETINVIVEFFLDFESLLGSTLTWFSMRVCASDNDAFTTRTHNTHEFIPESIAFVVLCEMDILRACELFCDFSKQFKAFARGERKTGMVIICPYIEDIKPEITVFLLTSNGFVFQATHDSCDFARGGISFFVEFAEKTSSIREAVEERLELWTPFDFICHFTGDRGVTSNHELVAFGVNDYSLICAINLFCAHIITRIDAIVNVSFDIWTRFG